MLVLRMHRRNRSRHPQLPLLQDETREVAATSCTIARCARNSRGRGALSATISVRAPASACAWHLRGCARL